MFDQLATAHLEDSSSQRKSGNPSKRQPELLDF
jgi:hypothetical protein